MAHKILDHIEHVVLGSTRHVAPHGVDFLLKHAVDDEVMTRSDINVKIRGELRVFFEQSISEGASPDERRRARELAKLYIARHLYGDVVDALYETREMLWQEGIRSGDAHDRISSLIDELRGTFSRFES